MSTPRPRDRRSPFLGTPGAARTPVGDSTLNLQRLPGHSRFPLTPSRFTSATPIGNRSASRFTPGNRGVGAPSTPYGARAMQRREARTPGRDRRKSGQARRETTFDILRNLGRTLAPTSQRIRSSPQEKPEQEQEKDPKPPQPRDEIDELDNEPELERPRLSFPIEDVDDDDGSPEMPAPRLSLAFDDEDITVEYPMRDINARDRARLSMMSAGGPRLSENFAETTRLESEPEAGDETGLQGEGGEDTVMSQGAFDRGGETEDLGRFNFDFNFPSPGPAEEQGEMGQVDDDEGFELPAVDLEQDDGAMPMPVEDFDNDDVNDASNVNDANDVNDDDNEASVFHNAEEPAPSFSPGFGLSLNPPPPASPSDSPNVLGGGLPDEAPIAPGSKQKKISRHGIPVPNLPSGVVRKMATQFSRGRGGSKAKISKQTLAAIEQATSWYFEQLGEDLEVYSKHAGRKSIDESDVIALMRRQRHTSSSTTVFSLAQKHLPKELLQDMRLPMPP